MKHEIFRHLRLLHRFFMTLSHVSGTPTVTGSGNLEVLTERDNTQLENIQDFQGFLDWRFQGARLFGELAPDSVAAFSFSASMLTSLLCLSPQAPSVSSVDSACPRSNLKGN
jgi:hypothetical protein